MRRVEQPRHQAAVRRHCTKDQADADVVVRPVLDDDVVSGADLALLEHPQIGAGPTLVG